MKYVFEVTLKPKVSRQQYIDAWKKGSAIIQKQPGALGTELHEKIGADGFLAVASWASKDARDRAMSELKNADAETRAALDKHLEFGYIKIIGSFEDAEWKVNPRS
ncbi:MAG TPA: antibiotic biosynthesis monooxygenase [Candidatus Saccharimonadales bacterium]|nr:antibiotic biosynthesis monooxygenase [Candidatus Saccharimonadales bacterium]